jgi:hypothetical protein
MPDDDGVPDPARLPAQAPDALRRFVSCATESVNLDLTDVGWLPKPEGAPDFLTPSASVEDGWTPQRATIEIGYGEFLSMEVPTSIVDGQLVVDASNLAFGIGDGVTKWVDAFNATLAAHGKQLDRLDVRGGELVLTKRVAAAGDDAQAAAVGVAAVGTSTVGDEAPGATPPAGGRSRPPGGCLAWIAGALAAVALAIGIGVVATSGGDSDDGQAEPPADTSVVTDDPPETDPPATDPPATDPPTTDQVGAAPADPSRDTLFCADFDSLSPDVLDGDLDGYLLIGGNCEPIDGAYLPTNCDDGVLPCAGAPDPVFAATGATPGFTHQPSQPDIFTGATGPSFATMNFFMRSWDPDDVGTAFFTSDCGGELLSGAAQVQPDGTATAEHPVLSFGPCQVLDLGVATNTDTDLPELVVIPTSSLLDGGFYEVGPTERAPGPVDLGPYPQIVGPGSVPQGWSHSVETVGNVLGGGGALGDGCATMVEPAAVHGSTVVLENDESHDCTDRFWVFAAAQQPGDPETTHAVIAHNATFVNPLGHVRPAIADTIEFDTGGPLFDGTNRGAIFPCGYGHVAFAVCTPDEPPMDSGAFVSVGVATGEPIPLDWEGTPMSFTVEFDQAAATALLDEAGWTMTTTGDERARALIRDDSVTFVFPQDAVDPGPDSEEIAYVLRSMIDGVTVDQPAVPAVGLITTPIVLPEQPDDAAVEEPSEGGDAGDDGDDGDATAPTETLGEFYAQLGPSLASGDLGFSLDRLDPLVYDAYPTECPAALEGFADPDLILTFVSDDGPEPWIWELPDGRSVDVPDAIGVTVVLTGRGQSGAEAKAHVRLHDGGYHWFTFCDG